MVLADLGSKVTRAFHKLNSATVIDDEVIEECLKEIANALLQSDVSVKTVIEIKKSIKQKVAVESVISSGTNKRKFIQKCVLQELTKMLEGDRAPYKLQKGSPNVVMFVGLQGAGKTTTCTKYAHFYARKGWKVALVCADTFRAGAFDQLKQNATKARVPFYGSYTEMDPVKIAEDGVEMFRKENYELIIVDTSGRHRQEQALFDEMKQVYDAVHPHEVIFVMDSHIGQACYEQAKAFSDSIDIGSVIITKLDGHAKGGGAMSAVAATNAPIIFIGTGEHMEEMEAFKADSFVSRLMGLGDLTTLVESLNEAVPKDKQPEMMERLSKGIFTMRDMYEQLQTVTKMGSISQVMSMVPGMNQARTSDQQQKQSFERLKKFMVIMDSMTSDELDLKAGVRLDEVSRVIRLARGSGCSPKMIMDLLNEHKKMETMVGKMGKMGLMKDGAEKQLARNPNEIARKLKACMDPDLLANMGGAQNMVSVMQQMEKIDGAEDLMRASKKKKKNKSQGATAKSANGI